MARTSPDFDVTRYSSGAISPPAAAARRTAAPHVSLTWAR